jgi:probable phosphoglycerate mutase
MYQNQANRKQYTTLYVVRHGQSEANLGSKMGEFTHPSTWHESDLTPLGIQQIKSLSTRLINVHFDAIFSSDARRARKTAEILATERGLAINISKRLRETSAGETSKAFHDLSYEDKLSFCLDAENESYENAARRYVAFIQELSAHYGGLAILIVSHGALMRALLISIGFATLKELPKGSIENAGYTVLESDSKNIFLIDAYGIHKSTTANKVKY